MKLFHDLHRVYEIHIVHVGKEQAFWLLVSFLITFITIRIITHAIRAGRGPFRNVSVRGKHIHHLVPGIVLVLLSGYFAAALHLRLTRTLDAVAFGIGAALTLDEFALWLNLKDVYWEKQGRDSVDAVIIAAILASLVVLGPDFWLAIGRTIIQVL